MAIEAKTSWGGSLHTSFRLYPSPNGHLEPMLAADGKTPEAILQTLPYEVARSKNPGSGPDPKRYRDTRQVYETAGLLYEEDGLVHVTELGFATRRWVGKLTSKNLAVLGRHAAYALSACQLRTPIGYGYEESMNVFPFAYIWRAMLSLENKISSDELNRALFKVTSEPELDQAIQLISNARQTGDVEILGPESITGDRKDDRIVPWLSIASFGWTLIQGKEKGQNGYYTITSGLEPLLKEAASIRHTHRVFESKSQYVKHISNSAALPRDLR
jgi:hypothetical protein